MKSTNITSTLCFLESFFNVRVRHSKEPGSVDVANCQIVESDSSHGAPQPVEESPHGRKRALRFTAGDGVG